MRWTLAAVLRPLTFVLAIVVAVGAGRVVGALLRNRPDRALRKAIWPGAATGYAFLFDALGLPAWATFFVSVIAASLTKGALEGVLPRRGAMFTVRRGGWRRAVDLDELLP